MVVKDQINRKVELNQVPKRIVSLVPSQTELLFDLGLMNEIVGITNFCIHPKELCKSKKKIGGTKNPNLEAILKLTPDLVIANKEENRLEDVTQLSNHVPVYTSDVNNLKQAAEMINDIGKLVDKESRATKIIDSIKNNFTQISPTQKLKALYFIWKKPYMVAGSDTFISSLITTFGWENCISKSRYPTLNLEEIKSINPDLILLSTEPYPFKKRDVREFQELLPKTKILLVDGEYFSWYGSRLIHTPNYINGIIHALKNNTTQ